MNKQFKFFSALKAFFNPLAFVESNWQMIKFIFFCALIILVGIFSILMFDHQSDRLTREAIAAKQMILIDLQANAKNHQADDHKVEIDEVKPSYRYNKIAEADVNKPKIALVITDLGVIKSMTLMALDQDKMFTLGFSPYANNIEGWIDQSFSRGFETYVQIPVQPVDYPVSNPGPYALLQNLSVGENLSRLNWVISRSHKIAGFYTPQNDAFFTPHINILPVLEKIKEQDKILLYGNNFNAQNLKNFAIPLKLEWIATNDVIDNRLTEVAIIEKLNNLRDRAIANGSAIGYLSSYPLTFNTVKKWLENSDRNSFVIVPVSVIVAPNQPIAIGSETPKGSENSDVSQ